MGRREKLFSSSRSVYAGVDRPWHKKMLARFWRRWSKRDPEDAPTKRPTKGWAD